MIWVSLICIMCVLWDSVDLRYIYVIVKQLSLHLLVRSFLYSGGCAGPLFCTAAPTFCLRNRTLNVYFYVMLAHWICWLYTVESVSTVPPKMSGWVDPRHCDWSECQRGSHVLYFCVCVPAAHQGRVTVVLFVLEMEWLLSTGQDKNFTWHCSESGQQLGAHRTAAWVSGLQYPLMPPHPHPLLLFLLSWYVGYLGLRECT